MNNREAVLGTWNLLAFDIEYQDTGERRPSFGASPKGRIAFLSDGYMLVLMTSAQRPSTSSDTGRSQAFASMVAYSGKYVLEADTFRTDVDIAWNGAWLNTTQVRSYRVEDSRLFIVTAWAPHSVEPTRIVRGILEWERQV